MPARLSSPNEPMCSTTKAMSASVDLPVQERDLRVGEPCLRSSTEVHDDLDQRLLVGQRMDGGDDLGREGREQGVEVVDRFPLAVRSSHTDLHR